MSKLWRIFVTEARLLFSNVVTVIILLGLVLLPSLFTWFNVLACWDVFENTGNMKVAVANNDKGYQSDLVPLPINVGSQVESALRANDQIDWVFTTEEDAIDGAMSGKYYAAVVIPEQFSEAMLTFYQDGGVQAPIVYYTNEKVNAIAPKITDQGADSVSYQVNETFTETIAEISLNLAKSLSSYIGDSGTQSKIAEVMSSVERIADRLDQGAQALSLYATLASSSQQIAQSSVRLVDSTRQNAGEIATTAQQGAASAQQTAAVLMGAYEDLLAAIDVSLGDLDDIANQPLPTTPTSPTPQESADALRAQGDAVGVQISSYEAVLVVLQQDPVANADAIATTQNTINELTAVQNGLYAAADQIEAGTYPNTTDFAAQVASARAALQAMRDEFETSVRPQLQQLSQQTAVLMSQVSAMGQQLDGAMVGLSGVLGQVGSGLGSAASEINGAAAKMTAESKELRELVTEVNEALKSKDAQTLSDLLGGNIEVLANALAAPVTTERHAVFPVQNFGSAMTPLYASLALFIGALVMLVVTRPSLSRRVREELGPDFEYAPRHEFLGHFGIMALISLMQSTTLALGNMLFLQVQVANPVLFMLSYWISGLVYTFIVYSLVVSFANLGKALAVLILIAQVTGCGGSYPLQLLPGFVQVISPYLPATHVVNMMRAAMMGVYANDFWIETGILLLFLIPMALLGLVLRKPMAKFMNWYIEQVEESKLIG